MLAASPVARAQTTIHVPADQPTIQAGINAAHDGDTVLVAPGTYQENIQISGKNVVLRSEQGAAQTVIDGGKNNVTVTISEPTGASATVDGFTIQNGAAQSGSDGGITVHGAATIQNNTVKGNWGYGIDAQGLATILNNHVVTTAPNAGQPTCFAYSKAGINLSTNFTPVPGAPVRSRISGNLVEGDGTSCSGPGITVSPVNPVVIEDNTVRGTAAGIAVSEAQTADNDLRVIVRQNLVYNNQNGGLSLDYYALPGESSYAVAPVSIAVTNNTFFNNLTAGNATDGQGNAEAEVMLEDFSARMALYNNLIIANSAISSALNCHLANPNPNATPPVLDHNDLYNLQASSSPLIVDNCGYTGASLIGIDGNISANPLFAGPGDFRLQAGSPAAGTGNNSAAGVPATDLAGHPRVQDSRALGHPNVDMGAYQLAGTDDQPVSTLALTASAYKLASSGPLVLTGTLNSVSGPVASAPVTFLRDDVPVGTATTDATGTVKLSLPSLTPGVYRFTASYAGGSGVSPALSTMILVRATSGPSFSLGADPGSPVACGTSVLFLAVVYSPPGGPVPASGTVTFTEGTATLGQPNLPIGPPTQAADGSYSEGVSVPGTSSSPGTVTVGATFTGNDGSSGADTLAYLITADSTSTVLTSSANPSVAGQPVVLTATVTSGAGTPTGSVMFADSGSTLGTVNLTSTGAGTATATYTAAGLSTGSHTLTASYGANGCFDSSQGGLTQTVAAALTATQTTIQASPNPATVGQTVTITASVAGPSGSGTPTGTVTFFDGTTPLGSQPLGSNGTATFNTSSLAVGIHSLTATYAGNSTDAGSTSLPFQETIESTVASNFTISVANPSLTVKAGQTTSTTVNLKSLGNFADTINLTCSNLPTDVTCQFSPSTGTLTAGGTSSVTLTIGTGTAVGALRLPSAPGSRAPVLALVLSPIWLGGLFAVRRRKRGVLLMLVLVLSLGTVFGLTGCGQVILPYTVSPLATPGTYNVLVIGTGKTSNETQSTQLTLTITP